MKPLLFVLMLFCFHAHSQPSQQLPGKHHFEKRCTLCHGKQGDRQRFGAKNLRISTLSDSELMILISNGRNRMPSWRSELSENQIREIIVYIKTLRS